jgi:Holliday junction resolvase RusA-like endonuclease
MQVLSLTILGEPCSKANSRRLVLFGKRPASIKSDKALSYVDSFKLQGHSQSKYHSMFDCDVVVTIRIWYASRRPDLDESLILDCLQGIAYENDRQVKEKHIYWMGVDKTNPRSEIEIKEKPPF